eukprot:4154058-Pleurochrysis_carterae.AAC.1
MSPAAQPLGSAVIRRVAQGLSSIIASSTVAFFDAKLDVMTFKETLTYVAEVLSLCPLFIAH